MTDVGPFIAALRGPILVTGASGFIGANLLKMLLRVRSDVFGVEQRARSWRLADVRPEHLAQVDLTDPSAANELVRTIAPATVFSCIGYGAYSFEQDVERTYETNFSSVVRLAELLAPLPITAFVHAGTSSEYGANAAAPTEDTCPQPNSHYAVSKAATASFLAYMGGHRRFPCVNLRLYSVYGPLEDTSRLVPSVVRCARGDGFPEFTDPDISRDFVYVEDVCAAFVLAAANMKPELYGRSLNIGSGVKTTISGLAHLAKEVFAIGGEPAFGTMPARAWDLHDWYADPRRAQAAIGWRATTALDEGLRRTADWVATLTDREFAAAATKARGRGRASLSAVVACYNDAPAIPLMHERLTAVFRKLGIDYDLIFVNDGSPDDSAEIIRRLSREDRHVIGVTHSRNFGSQMAFRSGMEISTKDGVVLLDGDLQDPPELIEQFVERWEAGYDVVYGRRVKREMPRLREAFHKLFYRVFAASSSVPIPLDAGDFSLMDRRVVSWILNCPERDLFVRGLRAYVGFGQTGVAYVRPERAYGRSTNDLLKNVEWAKRGIFSFSTTPLAIVSAVGLVAFISSLCLAALEIVLRIAAPSAVPPGVGGGTVATLVFGSANLLAIGIVGEYVSKIMIEVKGRPRLIRSALIRDGEVAELFPGENVR